MNLSPHFTLEEFIFSDTATRLGIDNSPRPPILTNLQRTAQKMELVRTMLGNRPVRITSGFRCAELNAMVKGAANSAHVQGLAADFRCDGYGDPLAVCRELRTFAASLDFDQLIWEFGSWTHIGFSTGPSRRQVLTINPQGTFPGLPGDPPGTP